MTDQTDQPHPDVIDDEPAIIDPTTVKALKRQVGGTHYKTFGIQPVEFALVNNLNTAQANIIKYLLRAKAADDLVKAEHYCDLWLEIVECYRLPTFGRSLHTRNTLGLPFISTAQFVLANQLNWTTAEILRLIVDAPSATTVRTARDMIRDMAHD